jgi:hypothetical protein
VVRNTQTIEYGKFVEIQGDSRFPAISVLRVNPRDQSDAFPNNQGLPPLTSVDIYPKYGVIAYLANASDIRLTLSASEVDIGNVGLVDHYTSGFDTYASVIYTNTAPNGESMGAVSVKPYGTTIVDGTVRSTVSGSITNLNPTTAVYVTNIVGISANNLSVTISEQLPQIHTFNNFGIFTHRGWTMSENLIPMVTIRAKSTASKTVKILEYELGNNNANSSTVGYVWYEDATITGTVPAFSSVNTDAEYRFYTDAFGSNTPNGFTGGTKRHSGIVIGKNSEAESTLSNIPLSANGKTLTMCVQRLDSATKLDLWAAMTIGIY